MCVLSKEVLLCTSILQSGFGLHPIAVRWWRLHSTTAVAAAAQTQFARGASEVQCWGQIAKPRQVSPSRDSRLAKSCVFIVLMPIYLRWVWNVRRGALCVSSCVLCYVLTCAYSEWICDVWWVGSLALYVSRWTRKPDRAIRDYQKSQSGLCLSVPYRLTIPEQYIYCIYLLCRQTVEDRKVSLAVVDQKDDQS